jgi:hypothetical protein
VLVTTSLQKKRGGGVACDGKPFRGESTVVLPHYVPDSLMSGSRCGKHHLGLKKVYTPYLKSEGHIKFIGTSGSRDRRGRWGGDGLGDHADEQNTSITTNPLKPM